MTPLVQHPSGRDAAAEPAPASCQEAELCVEPEVRTPVGVLLLGVVALAGILSALVSLARLGAA